MRQHDPTSHFNPRSPCGERPAAEAIHIRANFLKLACYLGEKSHPQKITRALCVSPEISIEKIHESHAEPELFVSEILAGAHVPSGLKTID
jgi:hypothetical protein